MLHPLLNAVFNWDSCTPTARLSSARKRIQDAKCTIVIVPPLKQMVYIGSDILYHDSYLLSHIVCIDSGNGSGPGAQLSPSGPSGESGQSGHSGHSGKSSQSSQSVPSGPPGQLSQLASQVTLETLQSGWWMEVNGLAIKTLKGFPSRRQLGIRSANIWNPVTNPNSPALVPGTVVLLMVDDLLLDKGAPGKLGSIFKSTPESSLPNSTAASLDNPPLNLGNMSGNDEALNPVISPAFILIKQRQTAEKAAAELDYALDCLRYDASSGPQLAHRFLEAVARANSVLVEHGADDLFLVHQYAEKRLSGHIFKALQTIMDGDNDFKNIHDRLVDLDLGQVEIPNYNQSFLNYEKLTMNAAVVIDGMVTARTSVQMGEIFVAAMDEISRADAGTISADSLLGLFIISMLRAPHISSVMKRILFYINHFSPSGVPPSSGKVGYTLMVAESSVVQLYREQERLARLSHGNKLFWETIETTSGKISEETKRTLKSLYEHDQSILWSRKNGLSALFLCVARGHSHMLRYLLVNYPDIFSPQYVYFDRDLEGRTLLMAALVEKSDAVIEVLTDYVLDFDITTLKQYLSLTDGASMSVAHYIEDEVIIERVGALLAWSQKNVDGKTGLLVLAEKVRDGKVSPGAFRAAVVKWTHADRDGSMYDHFDTNSNSLLHILSATDKRELMSVLVENPTTDINWTNHDGDNALMVSCARHQQPMIDMLLANGAEMWQANSRKVCPVEIYPDHFYSRYVSQAVYSTTENGLFTIISDVSPSSAATSHKLEDFYTLVSTLRLSYPYSWIPTLGQEIKFPQWLRNIDDLGRESDGYLAQRLSLFIRLLKAHGTFGESAIIDHFCNNRLNCEKKESYDEKHEGSDSPSLSRSTSQVLTPTAHETIVTFFRYGIEHLAPVHQGLQRFSWSLNRLITAKLNSSESITWLFDELQQGYIPCLPPISIDPQLRETFSRHTSPDLLRREFNRLKWLDFHAGSMLQALSVPIDLVHEIEDNDEKIILHRNKVHNLGESRTWLPSMFETKRVNDIQAEKDIIVNLRRSQLELGRRLNRVHFALASELSSFNKGYCDEILDSLSQITKSQMQLEKDHLCRLERILSSF